MSWFDRDKVAKAAQEIADSLTIPENIKALQTAVKEVADSVRRLDDRLRVVEAELRAAKAELRSDALRETQAIVNAVQGGLNQRIQDIAIDVAILQHDAGRAVSRAPRLNAPDGDLDSNERPEASDVTPAPA